MKTKYFKVFILIMSLVLLLTLFAGCNDKPRDTREYAQAYITFAVNPELEIISDANGKIDSVYCINEDAEILISNIILEGMNVEDAIDALIETAVDAGYIDSSTEEIEISVEVEDNVIGEQIRKRIKARVNARLENKGVSCKISESDMSEYAAEAEELGISVKKTKIINRLLELDPLLELDDFKTKSMSQLLTEYSALIKNNGVNAACREEYKLERNVLIAQKVIRNQLKQEIATIEQQLTDFSGTEEERTALEASLEQKKAELETINAELSTDIDGVTKQYRARNQERKQAQKSTLAQMKSRKKQGKS